ncbi:MAG: phosphoheptose isomerase [Candidatus Saccharibacteria bacterium]|nr:phosphoheptose isomerase [Candidatus Saccharibacteria bacterium]
MNKQEKLKQVKQDLILPKQYTLADVDEHKPWGAYYRLADEHAEAFVGEYFPKRSVEELGRGGSLSPKFLVFEPGKKLSLQYHVYRAEIWRVISGTLTATVSESDEEGEWQNYTEGEELSYGALMRHRAGAPSDGDWCIVAEIWQHTDADNPTSEEDIIRLKDDFGRA